MSFYCYLVCQKIRNIYFRGSYILSEKYLVNILCFFYKIVRIRY